MSTTTMAISTSRQPVRAAAAAPPPGPPHILDVNVGDLRVPLAGRVYKAEGHDLPLLVEDPDGTEVVWVTRALRALQGEGLSRSTLKAYAKSFLRAARPMWALGCDPQVLTTVEYAVVRNWLRLCQRTTERTPGDARRPLAGSTLVQTEAALVSIYAVARRAGLVAIDPVAGLRGSDDPTDEYERSGFVVFDTDPAAANRRGRNRRGRAIAKTVHKEIVVLDPGDRTALRHARKPRDRALWTLCLDSGPRISEALSLTTETYEPYANQGRVVGKGLDGATRVIPISDESLVAIDAYLRDLADRGFVPGPGQPIFRSLRAPYPPMTYDAAWKALRRALCRDDVHPHALRHTAATELLDLLDGSPGTRLERLRIVLGHRSVATTQKYTHVTLAEAIAAHVTARQSPLRPASTVLRQTYDDAEMALLADIRKEHTA